MVVKTQSCIEFLNSISFNSLQVFGFLCLSSKTLDRFFILLHHCFCSNKSQIHTSQSGLTVRFINPRKKNICSCIQKIKNKYDGGADVGVRGGGGVSMCLTHRLVVTAKDKRPLLLICFTKFEQVFVG